MILALAPDHRLVPPFNLATVNLRYLILTVFVLSRTSLVVSLGLFIQGMTLSLQALREELAIGYQRSWRPVEGTLKNSYRTAGAGLIYTVAQR